jgi:hypothetical protein
MDFPRTERTLAVSLRRNLLLGLGLGAFFACSFSVWVTIIRLAVGPASFIRNGTTYHGLVGVYFGGFLLGGFVIGLLMPLSRFLLGRMLLGIVGVFPVYLAVNMESKPVREWFASENLVFAVFASVLVGGAVGIWSWIDDHKKSR